MTVSVVSSANGTDRVPLDAIGPVGSPAWAHAWPTGCLTAACTVGVDAGANHRAFNPGRRIEVFDGLCNVWTGVLTEAQRGTPWSLAAQGYASLAVNYMSLDWSGAVTSDPNTAVDAAIARGLPWVRVQTLPTPTLPTYAAGTLADLLNQVAAASGTRWGVGADRQISMTADPTTPTLLVTASDPPGGRSVDDYASALYGRYQNSATTPPLPAVAASTLNAATGGPAFGRREILIDLTPAGPITTAAAAALLDARFPLIQASASFTGSLQVQTGDVLTMGGVPVRLTALTAGQRVRAIGAAADPNLGELLATTKLEFVIGQVDLAGDAQTATVTPLGASKRDFATLLEVAAAPDTSHEVDAAL